MTGEWMMLCRCMHGWRAARWWMGRCMDALLRGRRRVKVLDRGRQVFLSQLPLDWHPSSLSEACL